MAVAESILFQVNSTNYSNATPHLVYRPQTGNSGFITTLKLTVNLNSIEEASFPYIPDDTPPDVIQQILDEVATNTEFREILLFFKKGTGNWIERATIRIFNKEPYYDVPLIRFFSDANTIDVAEDFSLGIQVKIGNVLAGGDSILVWGSAVEEKKNDPTLETFGDRISALEYLLQLFGAATPAVAGTNGLVAGAAVGQGEYLLRGDRTWQDPADFATPAQIDQAIVDWVGTVPANLDTLIEFGNAINNDANFASTVTTQLGLKAPLANPTFTGLVTTAGQIQFPAVQVASSNSRCLDDYLEGVFTPTIVGTTATGAGTYITQSGSFTKIGKRVFFELTLDWSAHTGSGFARVGNLPYICSGVNTAIAFWVRNFTVTPGSTMSGYILQGTSQIVLSQAPPGGEQSGLALDSAGAITVSGSYLTTS